MEPKSVKEVSERVKGFYEKAQQATRQNNYDYAIEMYSSALKQTPEFRDARLELRKVELEKIGNKVNATKQSWIATKNALALNMKGPSLIKKGDYLGAIEIAESILAQDPTVPGALKLLATAADEGGYDWLAIDTLEFYCKLNPKDTAMMKWLVSLYTNSGRGDAAIRICQKMLAADPSNGEIQSLMKNAMARTAIDKSSFMNENKDPAAAANNSAAKSATSIPNSANKSQEAISGEKEDTQEIISKYEEMINQGNDSVDIRKRLAKYYIKANLLDQAIDQLDICIQIGGASDPQVQSMMFQAVDGRFENAIKAWRDYGLKGPNESAHADEEIAKLEEQRLDYKILRAKERVLIYSNDPNVHMELALLLWERQEIEEALVGFTKAQGSPRCRKKATLHKAKCLAVMQNHDEAIQEFELLISECPEMNKEKIEGYYEMAASYLQKDNLDKALEIYKLIEKTDPNYRDLQELIKTISS